MKPRNTPGVTQYQASKFSAHGLNSAPGRSILVILEINVNQLRKKFLYRLSMDCQLSTGYRYHEYFRENLWGP